MRTGQGLAHGLAGRAMVASAIAMATIGAIGIACVSKREPSGKQALRPVSLPDVSLLVNPPVREQLRERYAAVMSKTKDPAATAVDLGAEYGAMGRLLLAAEYFRAAEPCFLNAEALAPGDLRWPYYLGHVYRLQGDTPKSAAAFERALVVRPDDEATLVWLGRAYLDQGRTAAAEPLFKRALSVNARSAASLFGLGRVALARQDFASAAEYLGQATAVDGRASVLHYPLAMAYRGLGKPDKAEAELRQRGDVEVGLADPLMDEAVESLETSAAYEMRAMRASQDNDWTAAAGYLRRSIELGPENAELRTKLGIALLALSPPSSTSSTSPTGGDPVGAEEQFRAAIRLSPTLAPAHLNLGLLMASTGRNQEAVEEFAAAVKYAPDDPQARFQLGEALRTSGRAKEALAHYERVLTIDPSMIEARFGYAMTLVLLKRYAEARERLTEDARRYPQRPEFAQALARLK